MDTQSPSLNEAQDPNPPQSMADIKYDLNLLRGWQRSQIRLLKEFATNQLVNQTLISGASGMRQESNALGGKITALTRAKLIQKAGKDDDGKMQWQLNEDKVDREKLTEFIEKLGV